MCLGQVGTSSKVCCRLCEECSKKRHASNQCKDAKSGYYIKANDNELFLDSVIAMVQVNLDVGRELLGGKIKVQDIATMFEVLADS